MGDEVGPGIGSGTLQNPGPRRTFRDTIVIPSFNEAGKHQGAEYTYGWVAGTGMAAPQVTGAVAAYRRVYSDAESGEVESALERAAYVPDQYDKTYYGSGFLNIVDAR